MLFSWNTSQACFIEHGLRTSSFQEDLAVNSSNSDISPTRLVKVLTVEASCTWTEQGQRGFALGEVLHGLLEGRGDVCPVDKVRPLVFIVIN